MKSVFDIKFGKGDKIMRRCNRCGSIVFKSELPEYLYQCFNCDEDLYSFETYEDGTNIENALLDELYVYVLREYNNGTLSEKDQKRYVEIVDMLQSKGWKSHLELKFRSKE